MICDKADKAQVLLGNVERRETPALRRIILMDTFDAALLEQGQGCGVHIQAMAEVEVGGARCPYSPGQRASSKGVPLPTKRF